MTDAGYEEALEFVQVRDGTAQWEVKYGEDLIARVTERVVDEVLIRLIAHAKTF